MAQMDNEMLSHDKIIEELNEVLQVDIDAVGAYQAAIDAIHEVNVIGKLLEFKRDHERHVSDLQSIVLRHGGEAKRSPDFKGILRKGFTRMAGLVGCEATLRAMLSNEKAANDVYDKHCRKPFPAEVLEVLRRNFGDEQRHYAWIQSAVQQRMWEADAHATP